MKTISREKAGLTIEIPQEEWEEPTFLDTEQLIEGLEASPRVQLKVEVSSDDYVNLFQCLSGTRCKPAHHLGEGVFAISVRYTRIDQYGKS